MFCRLDTRADVEYVSGKNLTLRNFVYLFGAHRVHYLTGQRLKEYKGVVARCSHPGSGEDYGSVTS
jgi:hypothetical protein